LFCDCLCGFTVYYYRLYEIVMKTQFRGSNFTKTESFVFKIASMISSFFFLKSNSILFSLAIFIKLFYVVFLKVQFFYFTYNRKYLLFVPFIITFYVIVLACEQDLTCNSLGRIGFRSSSTSWWNNLIRRGFGFRVFHGF